MWNGSCGFAQGGLVAARFKQIICSFYFVFASVQRKGAYQLKSVQTVSNGVGCCFKITVWKDVWYQQDPISACFHLPVCGQCYKLSVWGSKEIVCFLCERADGCEDLILSVSSSWAVKSLSMLSQLLGGQNNWTDYLFYEYLLRYLFRIP